MKTKTIKGILTLLTAVILVGAFALSFTACDNGSGDPPPSDVPQSVTYVSTDSEGNLYTLEITENVQGRSARYAAKSGDSFKFTVELFNDGNYTVALTYSGTIDSTKGSGADIELRITVNGEVLDITISGSNMTVISGNIVDEDGDPLDISDTASLTPAADKTLLGSAITAANTAKQGVAVSVNGSDIDTTVYWVTQTQMDSFNTAIATAQAFYDDSEADQSMINSARITLVAATNVFIGQKQLGTKTDEVTVNKIALGTAISAANTAKEGVLVSVNGSDIENTVYWVTQGQMEIFTAAITTAQIVYNNTEADQAMVNTQKTTLETATTVFNGQKQLGTKVEQQQTEYDVYVAGSYSNNGVATPCYWKNSVRIDLSFTGYNDGGANKIIVDGDDIYVQGWVGAHGRQIGCYWKNGTITVIDEWANDMAVSNGDVYLVGSSSDYPPVPFYWKNGVKTNLSIPENGRGDQVRAICISGGIIYIAGQYKDANGKQIVCYWANGVRNDLPENTSFSTYGVQVEDITVNGNIVYLTGWLNNSNPQQSWLYTTNGGYQILPSLTTDHSIAHSITISDNDIYIAGYSGNGSFRCANYWKNNQLFVLSGGSIDKDSFAYSISVSRNDVFIAGSVDNFFDFETMSSGSIACYWKNGTLVVLSENASASGIFIVER